MDELWIQATSEERSAPSRNAALERLIFSNLEFKEMRLLSPIMALCLLMIAGPAPAETHVELVIGQAPGRMALLRPSTRRYIRYLVDGPKRSAFDLWERRVEFQTVEGISRLHLSQRWDGVGERKYVNLQDSWFDAATFRPISHVSTLDREGRQTVSGYRFDAGRVVGMPEIEGNARQHFDQHVGEPPFNFEYDLELFQTLPWRVGLTVSIPFYEPGGEPTRRYVFRVVGSQQVRAADGLSVDCWKVTTDYGTGVLAKTFWISRRTQVLIREEAIAGKALVVTTLLQSESADGD